MPTQSIDPRTGDVFGNEIPDTTVAELAEITRRSAAVASSWASLPLPRRAEVLRAMADALDADAEELAALADRETALGLPRLTGEVARTSFTLRLFAEVVESGAVRAETLDPAVDGPPPAGHPELRRVLIPIGPVAVYGASNFPFAFSVGGGDTASALAAGCPVVVKAHPAHPQTSIAVYTRLRAGLHSCGIDPDVIQLVHGYQAGVALIDDPLIDAAAFTGSVAGGRALFDRAAARPNPIPFYGELGSINPVVVLPSAAERPSLAVEYVDSLLLGTGQFCTNPSLLLVPTGSGLVGAIAAELPQRDAGHLVSPGVAAHFSTTVAKVAAAPGVRQLAGALPDAPVGAVTASPVVFTISAEQALADRTVLEVECFGPSGVIVEYDSAEQLVELLASLPGALVGCVHADIDDPRAAAAIAALTGRVGRVVWNGWPTGVAVTMSQHHGGPYPASTVSLHTSVGGTAVFRFLRPVAFQSLPAALLPESAAL